MRLGMAEILTAGSVFLLATGHSTVGWVFLGLGIFGAALRWGVELQAAQQQKEAWEKGGEELSKVFTEVGKVIDSVIRNSSRSDRQKDSNLH